VDEAALERFNEWRGRSPENARIFAREREFWQGLQALDGRARAVPLSAARISRRGLVAAGVATAVAGATLWARPDLLRRIDYRTAAGESAEVKLPDGSLAFLNTDTALALDFREGVRQVELLRGEAEFDVEEHMSAPFAVDALGGRSSTLKASFAVNVSDDAVTVTSVAGSVAVTSGGAPMLQLPAGLQSSYRKGRAPAAASIVDTASALAWRQGRIVFDGLPFGQAVHEVGRYLPERIVRATSRYDRNPVSGLFSTAEAFAALAALAGTQGLSVRRVPGVVILIS